MNNEFDDFFSQSNNEETEEVEVLEVEENTLPKEEPKKEKQKFKISFDFKNDKILTIQLALIGIWLILTVIIYFFGYNLFSPFINV